MSTFSEKDAGKVSKREFQQIRDDQVVSESLKTLLTLGPDTLESLDELIALIKRAKKDPDLIPFFRSLLALGSELHEYKKTTLAMYQDIRMLEERHPGGGLHLQDLALLESRRMLGRSAFLELVKNNAFEWLDSIPLSLLFRNKETPMRGGAPLSPLTISAYVKLCYLVPAECVIDDEIDDALRQYRSKHERQTHRQETHQRAAKRVERILKKVGIRSVSEFSKLVDLLSLKELFPLRRRKSANNTD